MFRKNVYRNPVYIVYSFLGFLLFILSLELIDNGTGNLEVYVFRIFNELGDWAYPVFAFLSIFGSIGFAWLVSIVMIGFRRYAGALKVLLATNIAYLSAYLLKTLEFRDRPAYIIENVNVREIAGSTGLPSGHAAVATALALILYQYIPKKYHGYITALAIGAMLSRLYLGVHLPYDLLAGFAVGLTAGSVVSYLFGSKQDHKIPTKKIKSKLLKLGFKPNLVNFLNADARGSVPYIVSLENGEKLFIKVVSQDNYISDWLFKIYRRMIYRRLEDEAPYFSPKGQIEHESYVAGLALSNNVNTPKVYGVFRASDNAYGQIQQGVAGKSLDKLSATKLTDEVLKKAWIEIKKLHDANIIHRDLRAANVIIDSRNNPWLIDFGFAEAAVDETQLYRDIVEFIASTSVIVGAKRAVRVAVEVEGIDRVKAALPFMQYEAMSSATTKLMKQQKGLIEKVKQEIIEATHPEDIKPFRMKRYNKKLIIIVGSLLLAVYVGLPQLNNFQASINAIKSADVSFLMLSITFSIFTYFAATMVYKTIAVVKIPLFRTLVIQFSSSFTNRLLPASAGGLATFGSYLHKQGHTKTQSVALLAINNSLGLIGFISIMFMTSIITGTSFSKSFAIELPNYFFLGILILSLIIFALIGVLPKIRSKIATFFKRLSVDMKIISARPARLFLALLWSMIISLTYAATMFIVAKALGENISLLQAVIVMTIGVASAVVSPTPGGIGGAEAGLTAALAVIGIGPELGLGIALVYRLVTYWLPIIPGFLCFQFALKKQYI